MARDANLGNVYSAQELRERADVIDDNSHVGDDGAWHVDEDTDIDVDEVVAMLRQAADDAEELAHLRDEQIRLVAENARLAARLEAVVKVAKEQFDIIFHSPMCWDEDENEFHSLEQLKEMDALEMVVATARGRGGAE